MRDKPKRYINKRDHEAYELIVSEKLGADGFETVYQCKNEFHFWEGTEKEFQREFLKL